MRVSGSLKWCPIKERNALFNALFVSEWRFQRFFYQQQWNNKIVDISCTQGALFWGSSWSWMRGTSSGVCSPTLFISCESSLILLVEFHIWWLYHWSGFESGEQTCIYNYVYLYKYTHIYIYTCTVVSLSDRLSCLRCAHHSAASIQRFWSFVLRRLRPRRCHNSSVFMCVNISWVTNKTMIWPPGTCPPGTCHFTRN